MADWPLPFAATRGDAMTVRPGLNVLNPTLAVSSHPQGQTVSIQSPVRRIEIGAHQVTVLRGRLCERRVFLQDGPAALRQVEFQTRPLSDREPCPMAGSFQEALTNFEQFVGALTRRLRIALLQVGKVYQR